MGNYRFEETKKKRGETSAGWRGIGCLLMIFLPIVAYYGGFLLLRDVEGLDKFWYGIAPGLFGKIAIPGLLLRIKSLLPLWQFLYDIDNLSLYIAFGSIILFVLSGIVGIIYSIMHSAVMPSRYGPMDAPPPKRRKTKKYSR